MKPRFRDALRYRFDNLMSKGVVALIGLLGFVTLIFISVVAGLVVVLGLFPPTEKLDFPEALWASLLRTLDPGTMGQDAGLGFRTAMLLVTLTGLILVASLIGIVSNAFNEKVDQLRKGRSLVLEKNHTLLLGWNQKIFQVIHELTLANESLMGSKIVVLANRDKVQMEDELKTNLKQLSGTKIIVRSGDPMSLTDLKMTQLDEARSIVILAPDEDEEADNFSIKTALAILNNPSRRQKTYNIVGEIKDNENLEVARLVGKNEVEWILGADVVSRLIVQTSRQRGLSTVFSDLLDFEGSELYLVPATKVASFEYGEASLSFQRGALIGIDRRGDVLLNPRADEVILEDDLLIVFAEDENKIAFGDKKGFNEKAIKIHSHEPASKELTLILGSNSSLPMILREIDNCAAKGSKVMLVDELASHFMSEFKNIRLETQDKNPSSRKVLNELKVPTFDHIIVLADRDRKSTEQADARTLLTLLNLRAINASNPRELNIVTEMLNDKNRELAESTNADDFIISDKLVSNMITMVSENTELSHVLQAVLASEGAQVRLHPASWYVKTGMEVDFYTITEAATRRGDSAIGYRLAKDGQEIYLNPNRDELVSFGEQDRIVVLSAD